MFVTAPGDARCFGGVFFTTRLRMVVYACFNTASYTSIHENIFSEVCFFLAGSIPTGYKKVDKYVHHGRLGLCGAITFPPPGHPLLPYLQAFVSRERHYTITDRSTPPILWRVVTHTHTYTYPTDDVAKYGGPTGPKFSFGASRRDRWGNLREPTIP